MRKKGRNNVTVEDLINVITPKGRGKSSVTFYLDTHGPPFLSCLFLHLT